MITGIGTDLVEIARVQKAIGRSAFFEKVYTEKERELIAVRAVRAATHFAAFRLDRRLRSHAAELRSITHLSYSDCTVTFYYGRALHQSVRWICSLGVEMSGVGSFCCRKFACQTRFVNGKRH